MYGAPIAVTVSCSKNAAQRSRNSRRGRPPAPASIPYFYLLFSPISRVRNPLPQHEALFRFSTDHAEQIYRALEPELSDEVNPRSATRCWLEGATTLVVKVESEDTASLRAALNMYLRLVNVADEVQCLVKK
jgi:KEOPS complex subunit Pcc1